MGWGPGGGMGGWCCNDGKNTGQWTQDTCTCSSCLHKDTFQITLSTVAKEAVAELMTVSLLLFHEGSPYQWGQPSPAPRTYLSTAGGNQPSHILDPLVYVSALFLVFITLPVLPSP